MIRFEKRKKEKKRNKKKKKRKKGKKEKRKKKKEKKERNVTTYLCIISSSIGVISTFESYSFGVFIFRDLSEISMRFFFPWATFSMYF